MSLKIFLHGLESSSQGVKAVFFRNKYPDMLIPDFTDDLDTRMQKLKKILADQSDIIFVGSSFGGLMATVYAMENESAVNRMILLAPAINLIRMFIPAYRIKSVSIPVHIYHGDNDEVISLSEVERVSIELFLDCTFNRVEDDHYLHKTFTAIDWNTLLL